MENDTPTERVCTGYFNYRLLSDSTAALKTYHFKEVTQEKFKELKKQFSAADLYFLYGTKLVIKNKQ